MLTRTSGLLFNSWTIFFPNLSFIATGTLTAGKQMACQLKWSSHAKTAFTLLVRCWVPVQNTSLRNENKSKKHLLPFSLNFKSELEK